MKYFSFSHLHFLFLTFLHFPLLLLQQIPQFHHKSQRPIKHTWFQAPLYQLGVKTLRRTLNIQWKPRTGQIRTLRLQSLDPPPVHLANTIILTNSYSYLHPDKVPWRFLVTRLPFVLEAIARLNFNLVGILTSVIITSTLCDALHCFLMMGWNLAKLPGITLWTLCTCAVVLAFCCCLVLLMMVLFCLVLLVYISDDGQWTENTVEHAVACSVPVKFYCLLWIWVWIRKTDEMVQNTLADDAVESSRHLHTGRAFATWPAGGWGTWIVD